MITYSTSLRKCLTTEDLSFAWLSFNFLSGLRLRVENTDRCSKSFLGTREELTVGLDRVHGDDEVDGVGRAVDVLEADEGLAFLRLPDDRVEVLRLLVVGHCRVVVRE